MIPFNLTFLVVYESMINGDTQGLTPSERPATRTILYLSD